MNKGTSFSNAMIDVVLVVIFFSGIVGCSAIFEATGIVNSVDNVVAAYCDEVSEQERLTIREQFNSISDHAVIIECNVNGNK